MESSLSEKTEDNINIELSYSNKYYALNINREKEDIIKFMVINKSSNDKERYIKELNLEDLKKNNNYFQQFDNLNFIEKEIENSIKNKDIAIEDVSNKEIILKLKFLGNDNNIIKIILKKVENDIIMILENQYKELKQRDEEKDKKIEKLEGDVESLLNEMQKKEEDIKFLKGELIKLNMMFKKFLKVINQNDDGEIDDISKILDKTNILTKEDQSHIEVTIEKEEIISENQNQKNNELINDDKNTNVEKISVNQNQIDIEINNNKKTKEENKENNLINEKDKNETKLNNNEIINKTIQTINNPIKIDNKNINELNKTSNLEALEIISNIDSEQKEKEKNKIKENNYTTNKEKEEDKNNEQLKISNNNEIKGNNQLQENINPIISDVNKLKKDKQINNNNVILNTEQDKNINERKQSDNQNKENIEPINQNNKENIQPENDSINQNNKPKIKNSNFEKILENSIILQSEEDIELLLKNFHNKTAGLELIYNSRKEEENEEKLLNAYIDKEDLIFLVKTDKSKRFGGYAHESFQREEFMKKDKNAFLFSLDKKTIYESKGKSFSIWRGSNTKNSINFGTGTDLKIYHNFLKEQSKTFQTDNDYDYKKEDYALNDTDNFNVINFEIYKVNIQSIN